MQICELQTWFTTLLPHPDQAQPFNARIACELMVWAPIVLHDVGAAPQVLPMQVTLCS
jgi:hypothetical protein